MSPIAAGTTVRIGINMTAIGTVTSNGQFNTRALFGTGGGETPTTNNIKVITLTIN